MIDISTSTHKLATIFYQKAIYFYLLIVRFSLKSLVLMEIVIIFVLGS